MKVSISYVALWRMSYRTVTVKTDTLTQGQIASEMISILMNAMVFLRLCLVFGYVSQGRGFNGTIMLKFVFAYTSDIRSPFLVSRIVVAFRLCNLNSEI